MRLIPLIDDLSIQAVDGTLLRRSRPALFQGLGRRPLAGDRWRPLSGGNADPAGSRPVRRVPARAVPAGGLREPGRAGVRVPLLGPRHRGLREAGPDLDEPPQAAARRRRQADQRQPLGPVLRLQRRRHDGHRARRRPLVLPAGADPARQRAAAVRDAPAAAGPLPPRGRAPRLPRLRPPRRREATSRRCPSSRRRPRRPTAPTPPTAAAKPPVAARSRSSRSASRSASSPPRRCRSPAPSCGRARRAAASGGRSRSSARRRSRPRRCRQRPGSTTRTRASRPDTCWARSCSRPWRGDDLRRPATAATQVQPAPAYARQAQHTRRHHLRKEQSDVRRREGQGVSHGRRS